MHAASCTLRLLSSRRSVLLKLRKLQSENCSEPPKKRKTQRESGSRASPSPFFKSLTLLHLSLDPFRKTIGHRINHQKAAFACTLKSMAHGSERQRSRLRHLNGIGVFAGVYSCLARHPTCSEPPFTSVCQADKVLFLSAPGYRSERHPPLSEQASWWGSINRLS